MGQVLRVCCGGVKTGQKRAKKNKEPWKKTKGVSLVTQKKKTGIHQTAVANQSEPTWRAKRAGNKKRGGGRK